MHGARRGSGRVAVLVREHRSRRTLRCGLVAQGKGYTSCTPADGVATVLDASSGLAGRVHLHCCEPVDNFDMR